MSVYAAGGEWTGWVRAARGAALCGAGLVIAGIAGLGCGVEPLVAGQTAGVGEEEVAARAPIEGALQLSPGRALDPDTQFYLPRPNPGAVDQVTELVRGGQLADALRLTALAATPRGVWLVGGTPAEVRATVRAAMVGAQKQRAVPVLVAYNIPGRDCGGYSASGAQTSADYAAWIDGVARGIGAGKAMVILEPDGVALSPDKCGDIPEADRPARQAQRNAELNDAIDRLERQPGTRVYLDAGHSHWLSVGEIAERLVAAGLAKAQGFFLDASNYRATETELAFATWISKCVAFASDPEEGGWRLGNYAWCASQYYSPLPDPANNLVNPDDITTWVNTDAWYDAYLGTATPTAHFVVDTSRNGQGPWQPTASYPDAQTWCNPPGRGVGPRPTVSTGNPLADALLWIKVPGESDGSCNRGVAGATTDPEWGGAVDPAAGLWFSPQALELARLASPRLLPSAAAISAAGCGDLIHFANAMPAATSRDGRRCEVGHETLAPNDGWASSSEGTPGGSLAIAEQVFVVGTRAELIAALNDGHPLTTSPAAPSAAPKIIYVTGSIDFNVDDQGQALTCPDYNRGGYTQEAFLATYDPAIWGLAAPSGPLEAARLLSQQAQQARVRIRVGANTTIVGLGGRARLRGVWLDVRGASTLDVSNVIIRNLAFQDTYDCFPAWAPTDGSLGSWNSAYDSVSLRNANHVWIDHDSFEDRQTADETLPRYFGVLFQVHDGELDITNASDLVTVSWNQFLHHNKVMLIGSSDSAAADRGKLRVTLHHNLFDDVVQRAPRVRFGQVHVYNNLYDIKDSLTYGYSWGVGVESSIYAENNSFKLPDNLTIDRLISRLNGAALFETGTSARSNGAWSQVDVVTAWNTVNDPDLSPAASWAPTFFSDLDPTRAVPAAVKRRAGPFGRTD